MKEAVIVDAVRSPIGRHGGILKNIRPDDLAAYVITKLIERTGIRSEEVEDVYFGCTNQAGEDSRNVARNASLLAGLPYTIPGATVNRLCGSGLEAINQAGRAVETDHGDLFVAGGVESMTRGPWVMAKPANAFQRGDVQMYDSSLGWRFPNKRMAELYSLINNGETAENVADKYHISREDQDRLALASHQKALQAQSEGRLKDEIIPVEIPQRKGAPIIHEKDEGPRSDTSLEALAALQPSFKKGGTVTAGNSSPLSDGAAALLAWVTRGVDLERFASSLRPAPWWAWTAAAAGLALSYLLRALRIHAELGARHAVTVAQCLEVMLVHNAAVNLLPMRGGEAAYPWLAHRRLGVPVSQGIASLVWMRVQDALVLGLAVIALFPGLGLAPRASVRSLLRAISRRFPSSVPTSAEEAAARTRSGRTGSSPGRAG